MQQFWMPSRDPQGEKEEEEKIEIFDKYYAIVAPDTIRPQCKYDVVVSLHKSTEECSFKIKLTGPELDFSQTVDLRPMSSKTVQFELPKTLNMCETYSLEAEGLSAGLQFKKSSILKVNSKNTSVFIQTDKAMYKPGDIVRYRVLALDSFLRPAKLDADFIISVFDDCQNLVRKVSKVPFVNGVFSGDLELSEQPVLGNWSIRVENGMEFFASKDFEVRKYVLPKFEVSVEAPGDVSLADDSFAVTVRGKYTYGKPIRGKVTLNLRTDSYHHHEKSLQCTKTVDFDGKADVPIDFVADLKLSKHADFYIPPVEVKALIEEEHTGLTKEATCRVHIYTSRYKFDAIDMPYEYHPGESLEVKVSVKHINGAPVLDTVNKVTLYAVLSSSGRYFPGGKVANKVMKYETMLDEMGLAKFAIVFDKESSSSYMLRLKYLDEELEIGHLNKHERQPDKSEWSVKVATEKISLDQPIPIQVTSKKPFTYFLYKVLSRGNILASGIIDVPEEKSQHVFTVDPSYAMIPTALVIVSYVEDGIYRCKSATIKLEKKFENKIAIDVVEKAQPGDDVCLKIETAPESTVGLMAVDQSVLLLKSGNDLNREEIFNDLRNYRTDQHFGQSAMDNGIVTLTNAHVPEPVYHPYRAMTACFGGPAMGMAKMRKMAMPMTAMDAAPSEAVQIREIFPETWIWDDVRSNKDGVVTVPKKVPDTLTSWIITGFSLSDQLGLGLTDEPRKLQVFQPFFVTTNLPYSVKRGEEISIPALVFNYTEQQMNATVTLHNDHGEFEFLADTDTSLAATVAANASSVVYFKIRATKIGQIALKIVATTPVAGDGVNQMLRVEPEGVTEYKNKALWLDLQPGKERNDKVDIEINGGVVPGSEYIELSVVGDILGPTIKHLDKLVRIPCGCGEQNMVNFVPNILVLDYLTSTGQLSATVEDKAKRFMWIGYQRELTYKHGDGSYSAFGESDRKGSTWLTAYVAKSFHQARKYIEVDEGVLSSALDFLAGTQGAGGEFEEVGKLIDFKHSNGQDKGVALTAFVLLAFLENKQFASYYHERIKKSLDYLAENISATDNLYALSISTLALVLGEHEGRQKALDKLDSFATKEGDRKWWAIPVKKSKKGGCCWWKPQSVDVEVTSYALMAHLHTGRDTMTALPIVKWLISQRNSNGGFASTQDTVVGLQALIAFATKAGCAKPAIEIAFNDDAGTSGSFVVNEDNALVLHSHVLSKSARHVSLTAKGEGSSLVQVSYRYNINTGDQKPSFVVKPVVQPSQRSDVLLLDIQTAYSPPADDERKESNMAVMEVNLPSGYTADEDCFDKLGDTERVMKIETRNDKSVVVIYFDSLGEKEVHCRVVASKTHEVSKQKPVAVVVFDYYDNNQRGQEFYELK